MALDDYPIGDLDLLEGSYLYEGLVGKGLALLDSESLISDNSFSS